MDKRTQIVKTLMHEAKLSDYQKFVKEELKDQDDVAFEDRGNMMKDIAKKWKAKKGSTHEAELSDYQKFVKEELKDKDDVAFEDRGKMMKDIAKKWKQEKKASDDTENSINEGRTFKTFKKTQMEDEIKTQGREFGQYIKKIEWGKKLFWDSGEAKISFTYDYEYKKDIGVSDRKIKMIKASNSGYIFISFREGSLEISTFLK